MKLDIWDTAGQEVYQEMTRNYYSGSAVVLIVYSVDSPASFRSVDNYFMSVEQLCANDCIVAIVGNKCDLVEDRRI